MAGSYRPQSPDLSSSHNTNLSGYRPQSPDLSALSSTTFEGANPFEQHQQQQHQQQRQQQYNVQFTPQHITSTPYQQFDMPAVRMKQEDETMTGMSEHSSKAAIKSEATDPTLGVELKTSFPVARIKRIMQADEDIGKVAQVTPHVVSRALELFMIKLIAASSEQARQAGGANAKGPKRVLVQHMKKAIQADDTFDFLADIITKVPDAPSKAKKEANSDSEDAKPKKRVRKQKSNDD